MYELAHRALPVLPLPWPCGPACHIITLMLAVSVQTVFCPVHHAFMSNSNSRDTRVPNLRTSSIRRFWVSSHFHIVLRIVLYLVPTILRSQDSQEQRIPVSLRVPYHC